MIFGKLNVIATVHEEEFKAWKDATEELIQRRPVTREQAVECIQSHFAKMPSKNTEERTNA